MRRWSGRRFRRIALSFDGAEEESLMGAVNRDLLTRALQAAWKVRVGKNAATRCRGRTRGPR